MRTLVSTISARRYGFAIVAGAGILYAAVYAVPFALSGSAATRCPAPPVPGQDIAAVFGRPADYMQTQRLLRTVRGYGFRDVEYRIDPCGHLEVVVPKLPDLKTANDVAREARGVGLHVTLERDS